MKKLDNLCTFIYNLPKFREVWVRKYAVTLVSIVAAVALFSCAGSGQKKVEMSQEATPAEKASAEMSKEQAPAKGPEKHNKVSRLLDNPPAEKRKVTPNIPAEYGNLVKEFDRYWDALKKKDYETAYNLESAEFKKTTGFDQYKGKFGHDVKLINVTALGVKKISEKEVIVTGSMILIANMEGPREILKPFSDEKWVKEGDGWRHVPGTEDR